MRQHLLLISLLLTAVIGATAQQQPTTGRDDRTSKKAETSKPFKAYLENDEFEVYLRINLHDQDIEVPGQELYGKLPGFLGKRRNSFCWVITDAEVESKKRASISLINDYGSEDLTASLIWKNDSICILRQEKGSTLKVPKNGKWQKLPKVLELKRK